MSKASRSTHSAAPWRAGLTVLGTAALILTGCGGEDLDPVTIGLITKQEDNPYWVTMREIAESTASDSDVELIARTANSDTDVETQLAHLDFMVEQQVDGILIAPTDSEALNPAIARAREAGIIVIAVDTPVAPAEAVDALFATDNFRAGELVGEYAVAKAEEKGLSPQIAMLNLSPGIASGQERAEGFLAGFGITGEDAALVVTADTAGNRGVAQGQMEMILADHPDVNVIYTVNEQAALGALDALQAADRDLDGLVLVSVDGGCAAIRDAVRPGLIDATAMQFPENMAREGVLAIADAVRESATVSGYLDTGLQLVSGDPAPGVDSQNVEYGVRNCWG